MLLYDAAKVVSLWFVSVYLNNSVVRGLVPIMLFSVIDGKNSLFLNLSMSRSRLEGVEK